MNMLKLLVQKVLFISCKVINVNFAETVLIDEIYYFVVGEVSVIDNSFAHEHGVEMGYHFEVDSLTIQSATDTYGEYMLFDNTDEDMIYNLTQILEDKLNEN